MQARSKQAPVLLGRQREREALDGLMEDLRSGRGRALVVRGEAGVGKSALLEYAVGGAPDMRVVRAVGVESEMELAFAGLHQLCAPLLGRLERLPAPQRDALGVVFGLRGGDAPDRFLVGLAVLTLLSGAAEERPVLCLVDDAQWLDRASAQVLAFVARRLLAEPVALVFAARVPGEELGGLADLEVRGLRSVVYRSAALAERRAVHLALAEVTDRNLDPDRRAWHLAAAAAGPDEEVAAELERSAGRAQARGGMAAAAAFLQRAVALTGDPARRAERALAAAQANLQAGAFDAALQLAAAAETGPLDDLRRARVSLLRGQVAFAASAGSAAPALLLKAARQLEPLDGVLARQTYLDAWAAALYAGRFASGGDLHDVSRAARSIPPLTSAPRPSDVLLDALAVLVTEGRATCARCSASYRSAPAISLSTRCPAAAPRGWRNRPPEASRADQRGPWS